MFYLALGEDVTVLDDAPNAGLALLGIVATTAWAVIYRALMRQAQATVHTAGGDEVEGDSSDSLVFGLNHFSVFCRGKNY